MRDNHKKNLCEIQHSPFDTELQTYDVEIEEWGAAVAAMTNDNGKSKMTGTLNCQGSTMTSWHLSKSSKSDNLPHAVEFNLPDHNSMFLFVVQLCFPFRCCEICCPEEMRTKSQASTVIPQCPVTVVSSIWASGCCYPMLHLRHSAPLDKQSNFTQVRSEGGNADAEMRICASTKTRSCSKWLERRWSWGWRGMGWRICQKLGKCDEER